MAGEEEGPRLLHLFETPLIVDRLQDHVNLNQSLKSVIAGYRGTNAGVRKSNWNGWQSDIDMLAWGGPAAQALADHFIRLASDFTAAGTANTPPYRWKVDMWANVSAKGAANEAHVHPGVVWSAVYWVDDGYGGAYDPGQGGELSFYDPRMPYVRMLPHDLRYRRPDGQPAQSQFSIRPEAGRIAMFPPWLLHSVHPYLGDGERISVAMNATAVTG